MKQAIELLRDRACWWSSPLKFNDPFDAQWDPAWITGTTAFADALVERHRMLMTGSIEQRDIHPDLRQRIRGFRDHLASLEQEQRAHALQGHLDEVRAWALRQSPPVHPYRNDIIQRLRIFSTAAVKDCILMWSHYGDDHSGAAVGLRTAALVDTWRPPCQVRYRPDLPVTLGPEAWLKSLTTGQALPNDGDIVEAMTLTKAEAWKYEQEWRFVQLHPPGHPGLVSRAVLPTDAVACVVIGCRADPIQAGELEALLRDQHPHVAVERLTPSRTKFELELVRVQKPG
jgi:hypothetical protein